MQITEIKVHLTHEERLKAFVSVTFDDCFAVRNMKIIEAHNGLILCMPSRKTANNADYKDIAHPITAEFRKYLEKNILQAYYAELEANADQGKEISSSAS